MSNDIVRFMDDKRITMATVGGHGFGAKVATATAINNSNRFTGVICLDGGPLDHRYYEGY
jgi:pimeloyl-ACP methyl ester carboxylesterase